MTLFQLLSLPCRSEIIFAFSKTSCIGSGTHLAYYSMGNEILSSGMKRPEREADHSPSSTFTPPLDLVVCSGTDLPLLFLDCTGYVASMEVANVF
jgi:hypothetical protein